MFNQASDKPHFQANDSHSVAFPETRKKVLIISSAFYPHVFGGAEIAAYNRAKFLAERGYDVNVLTVNERDVLPSWGDCHPEGFKLYRIESPRSHTLFERTDNTSKGQKILWHFQDYFDDRNLKLVSAVLDAVRPDHIEIDNLIGIGFNTLSEIARRNMPVVYILHDMNLACFNTGMIRRGKICRQQCFPCRGVATLRQTPLSQVRRLGFVSPSHANLERAKEVIPLVKRSLSCVIRNIPEDGAMPAVKVNSDHVRLLFVGRLDPVKGIEFLLRTLDKLSHLHNFHLNVLGKGPSEQQLKSEFGNKKWVTFRGHVPREEVASALIDSDLYCIPSLVAESYGLVTAQALQLGTPVIGSNAGGTAELVRDGITGILAPPGNENAWQEALSKILSNRKLLTQWHENAVRYAHEFDKETIGQAYDNFIRQLYADRRYGT